MEITSTWSLKDIVLSNPAAARVIESYHLDYCCGGKQTLHEACLTAGLNLDEILTSLQHAIREPAPEPRWDETSLTALIRFIVDTHHVFTRSELIRIGTLLSKVIARHGTAHSELLQISHCFAKLKADLGPHLLKEEQVLFPYLEALEKHHLQSAPMPLASFDTLDNPIRVMTAEHESVGKLLRQIRAITADFSPPADACPTYCAFYQALEGLEIDLMRHIHLENNVLFPLAKKQAGRS